MELDQSNIICNACDSSLFEDFSLPFGHIALRCQECGLVWAKDIHGSKDMYESAYDPDSEGFTWNGFLRIYERLKSSEKIPLNWFEKRFIDAVKPFGEKKLLEVGCSLGRFLLACNKSGWETHGLDIAEKAVQLAQKILPGSDIQTGTLAQPPWPNLTFDAITIWEVIEHVDDPFAMVCKGRDLLQDDGILAVSTPDWDSRVIQRHNEENYWPPFHIWFFNEKSMKALLKKADMEVVSVQRNIIPWSETFWPKWKRILAMPWLIWLGIVLGQGGGRLVIWAKKA